MKYLILISSLFFFSLGHGQSLPELKKSSVIFIYFTKKDNNTKKLLGNSKNKMESVIYNYVFTNKEKKDTCDVDKLNFYISTRKYEDFDAMSEGKEKLKLYISKHFLKVNKNKIIDRKLMDAIGYNKTFNLLKNVQNIFLIDEDEKHGGIYILKEADFYYETIE